MIDYLHLARCLQRIMRTFHMFGKGIIASWGQRVEPTPGCGERGGGAGVVTNLGEVFAPFVM